MKPRFCPAHVKEHYPRDLSKSDALEDALYMWRRQEFTQQHPDHHNNPWTGDWIILPDNTIANLVYLAHTGKLTMNEKFMQLVNWIDSGCYASELLSIIHTTFLLPASTTSNISTLASGTHEIAQTKQCRNCRKVGHNGNLSSFLLHHQHELTPFLVASCWEPCSTCRQGGHVSK